MRSRHEPPCVGEIQILRNQKAFFSLRRFPYFGVAAPDKAFLVHRLDIMSKRLQLGRNFDGQVFVKLDVHRICGSVGEGKSSSADAAANAMAA